jgi:hypothetical protein
MLFASAADPAGVIASTLKIASFLACALVLTSFGLFARDQLNGASKNQQSEIVHGVPTSPGELPSSSHHGQPRRFIDGAAKTLLSPFDSIVRSASSWARRGGATLLALLAYGFGLGFLARYTRGRPGRL